MDLAISTSSPVGMKGADDIYLVNKAVNGDQYAYSVLMDRYWSAVYQLMQKKVHNTVDAEDLALEAFGKAFKNLHCFVPRYAFSTWLFKIAVNNCIDHIRKKKLHFLSIDNNMNKEEESGFSENIRASMLNPEEMIIRDQKLLMMRQVLNKLSEKYRLMIELRYFEEMSYEEIAKELAIPLGTVKAQLFRAKELLYELLQKPGASAFIENRARRM